MTMIRGLIVGRNRLDRCMVFLYLGVLFPMMDSSPGRLQRGRSSGLRSLPNRNRRFPDGYVPRIVCTQLKAGCVQQGHLPEPQKLLRGDQTLKIEPRMLIPPNVETRELWWSFVVQLRVLQVLVAMFYTAALSFKRSLVTPITSRPAVPSGSCFLKHDRGLCVWRALCTQILLYRLRTFQA
jgi:hypothetical protein